MYFIRWDWVAGGRARPTPPESSPSPRTVEGKLHRRKLHKKLLHQMQELEASRRGIQVALEEQQVSSRFIAYSMFIIFLTLIIPIIS